MATSPSIRCRSTCIPGFGFPRMSTVESRSSTGAASHSHLLATSVATNLEMFWERFIWVISLCKFMHPSIVESHVDHPLKRVTMLIFTAIWRLLHRQRYSWIQLDRSSTRLMSGRTTIPGKKLGAGRTESKSNRSVCSDSHSGSGIGNQR